MPRMIRNIPDSVLSGTLNVTVWLLRTGKLSTTYMLPLNILSNMGLLLEGRFCTLTFI